MLARGEMKTASLLAKFSKRDGAALDAWSACRMATVGGVRAGPGQRHRSIEPGKAAADLIAVPTDTPRMPLCWAIPREPALQPGARGSGWGCVGSFLLCHCHHGEHHATLLVGHLEGNDRAAGRFEDETIGHGPTWMRCGVGGSPEYI